MNLKEAFRFQNKLQSMMADAQSILGNNGNITKVQNTYLRHKVMAEAEDEVTMEAPSTEYSENITEMAEFLLFLLDEREKLSAAIHKAKVSLPLGAGLDGEVSLNGKRQEIATLLRHMAGLRNGEVLIPNGGIGYRFNNEGNQVSYRCDVKRVTTINFDRNKIRKMCADLSKKSDETSAALDAALVNTPVEYEAPFDVNETFAEAFEAHIYRRQALSLLPFVDRLWLFKTEVSLQVADTHPALDAKTDDVLSGRNRINDRKLFHVHGNRLHLKSFPKREYFRILEALAKSKSKRDFVKKLSHKEVRS